MGETANSISYVTDNILTPFYYYCGLFISCRLSEKTRKAMDEDCKGKGGWCSVRKWWGKYNQKWAEIGGLNFFASRQDRLGKLKADQGLQVESPTGDEVTVGQDTTQKNKSLRLFSPDDFDPTRSAITSLLSGCLPP
jgi:hypothetical protein